MLKMPLTNPRQGRKANPEKGTLGAEHVLFFELPPKMGRRQNWGNADRYKDGAICLQLVEDYGGKETRVSGYFDVAALKQLIDWAEGRMVGEPSEDEEEQ